MFHFTLIIFSPLREVVHTDTRSASRYWHQIRITLWKLCQHIKLRSHQPPTLIQGVCCVFLNQPLTLSLLFTVHRANGSLQSLISYNVTSPESLHNSASLGWASLLTAKLNDITVELESLDLIVLCSSTLFRKSHICSLPFSPLHVINTLSELGTKASPWSASSAPSNVNTGLAVARSTVCTVQRLEDRAVSRILGHSTEKSMNVWEVSLLAREGERVSCSLPVSFKQSAMHNS